MRDHFEVVVVGAGPAGASVAKRASEAGVNILLLDRKKEIGIPVQCGELLPSNKEMSNILPKSNRAEKLLDIPESLIYNRCSRILVAGPTRKIYEFDFQCNIVDRRRFDKWLVLQAVNSGTKLWTDCAALSVQTRGKSLLVKKGKDIKKINMDMLVAADGPYSKMVKDLGLSKKFDPLDYTTTIGYEMGGIDIDPGIVEVYFGMDYAPGGYGWIIPKGERVANVGLGIRTPFSERGITVIDYLNRFINDHPLVGKKLKNGVILSKTWGLVPTGNILPKTYTENSIVVGDAAGHVMASNGGGIPGAIICGDIGGEIISNKVTNNPNLNLSEYEKIWKTEIGKELKTAARLRKIADTIMRSDKIMEKILEKFGGSLVESILRCRMPLSFDIVYKAIDELKKTLK